MSAEYNRYLTEHIGAVKKAALWMLDKLAIVSELDYVERDTLLRNVQCHDASKYVAEEYDPYDAYFYGEKDEDAFNFAWLHHIHANPHHWQHWLLVNDDDGFMALEMPKVYVFEMVADWWSFSWRTGNLSEVFNWYESHRDVMILHDATRELVEGILNEIAEKIGAGVHYGD